MSWGVRPKLTLALNYWQIKGGPQLTPMNKGFQTWKFLFFLGLEFWLGWGTVVALESGPLQEIFYNSEFPPVQATNLLCFNFLIKRAYPPAQVESIIFRRLFIAIFPHFSPPFSTLIYHGYFSLIKRLKMV